MSTPDSSHDQANAHNHDEPLPEEPKTPFWVTALGVALLVFGGLGYLFVHEPTVEAEAEVTPEPAAEPEKAPEAPPKMPSIDPRRMRGLPGLPPSGMRPRPPLPEGMRPPRPADPTH